LTPDWLVARPIAHRGLHDDAAGVIENTLTAAEAAIAAGFAIECDVQLSGDGEAFVFHDFTLDRLTDSIGTFSEMSAGAIRAARIVGATGATASPVPARGELGDKPLGRSPQPSLRETRRGRCDRIPAFAELLALVAGRTPIVCELKSRFDRDFRIADRIAALAQAYDGPLALKSFDPNLIAYLRLRWPLLGPPARPCPIGIVAQASYDGPDWDALSHAQKRDWATFEHYDRERPDFLSWNVDDLPHAIPFFVGELNGAPVMAWTVRGNAQREAARKWADQIVFEGAGRP
jgi:glycerophosphoryl diester phosphodiesterase